MNHKFLVLTIALIMGFGFSAYSEPLAIYFSRSCPKNYVINFTSEDFTNNYEGENPLVSVSFPTLPKVSAGKLVYNGEPVKTYDSIPVSELNNISFVPASSFTGEALVYWQAYDGKLYSPDAAALISVNAPPMLANSDELAAPASASTEDAFPYADMENHWAYAYAAETADLNIMRGEQIGRNYYFNPEKNLSRGDFVMLLNAALDISSAKPEESFSFSDSGSLPAWLDNQGKIAYEAGFLQGVSNENGIAFNPYDTLTRIEAIKMVDSIMSNCSNGKSTLLTFNDTASVPDWGKDSLKRMLSMKVISGYTDNTIRPYANINKATASKVICTMLSYLPPNGSVQKNIAARISD